MALLATEEATANNRLTVAAGGGGHVASAHMVFLGSNFKKRWQEVKANGEQHQSFEPRSRSANVLQDTWS